MRKDMKVMQALTRYRMDAIWNYLFFIVTTSD